MSWLGIALVVFIGLWIYERGRVQRLRHRIAELETVTPSPTDPIAQHSAAQDEIDSAELTELRERVQVLERIATDENSSEARKAQRIAREIESLRGDIARRSASKTEDVSE